MATYSNNTTIKFVQSVTLTGNQSYTVPANCYAVISVMRGAGPVNTGFGGGTATISVDGNTLFSQIDGSPSIDSAYRQDARGPLQIYVPAGKVVTTSVGGKGTAYVLMSLFQNSP